MQNDKKVFVDTAYLVALLNRRDGLHRKAVALAEHWASRATELSTSDAVLIEFANFFSRSPMRKKAIAWISELRVNGGWRIEPSSGELLVRAEARFAAHPDKTWSLTDCISMEAMLRAGIDTIATPDRHFVQAGFRILMT